MMKHWIVRSLVIVSCVLVGAQVAAAADIVVIVNAANSTATLDKAAVKAYYMNTKSTWSDGAKVRPVDNPDDVAGRAQFVTKVLGLSVAEFERYWIERQYASGDGPPAKATDGASVIKLVELFKGGIGFVDKAALDKAGNAKVKVVLTLVVP